MIDRHRAIDIFKRVPILYAYLLFFSLLLTIFRFVPENGPGTYVIILD